MVGQLIVVQSGGTFAGDADAAGAGLVYQAYHIHNGSFTGSRGSGYGDKVTFLYGQIDAPEGMYGDFSHGVGFCDVFKFYDVQGDDPLRLVFPVFGVFQYLLRSSGVRVCINLSRESSHMGIS